MGGGGRRRESAGLYDNDAFVQVGHCVVAVARQRLAAAPPCWAEEAPPSHLHVQELRSIRPGNAKLPAPPPWGARALPLCMGGAACPGAPPPCRENSDNHLSLSSVLEWLPVARPCRT